MRLRSLLLSLAVLLFPLFAAHAQSNSPKFITLPHHSPTTPQGLEGGFWRVDNNFDPILRLKNVLLKQPLNVTPILYFADGTEYDLPAITLEPAGVAQVNIRYALENVPATIQNHVSTFGMAGISYQWSWPAVIATIQNTDEIASLTITSSLGADVRITHAKPEAAAPQTIRGSWWLPTQKADAFVVLENSSLTQKQVAVRFTGHAGNSIANQTFQLPPHGSSIIQLSSALGAAFANETEGGIQIQYSGPDRGVVAYAGVTDESVGFSASPHLLENHLDPARPVHQVTLSAPGLLLGNSDPSMQFPSGTYFKPYGVLQNVSAQSRQIALSLTSAPAGGAPHDIPLGTITLAPGQTTQFDFNSKFTKSNPLPDGYGHLTATFQGQDGDIHMETGSVDQSGSYVFEVTPTQQAESGSRTICFWSIEGDNDSMIMVWNYKIAAQDLVLTLYYSGGQYRIPFHLEARQSYNLDMLSLVRSRVPDPDGNLIPDNIASGSAILSGPGGDADRISISAAASVFNVRNATCGGQCITCNGSTETTLNPSSFQMTVGQNQSAQFQLFWNTGFVDTNPSGTSWSTQSSAVATVNGSGTITGQGPGQTGVTATINAYPVFAQPCSGAGEPGCPYANLENGGSVNVVPCPTSTSIGTTDLFLLSSQSTPPWLSGLGLLVNMDVGPPGQTFNGAAINESISPSGGSCSIYLQNLACKATGGLQVGAAITNAVGSNGFTSTYPPITNVFYDEHVLATPNGSFLSNGQQCTIICAQSYTCGGNAIGSYTITMVLTGTTLNGNVVTDVSVSKR